MLKEKFRAFAQGAAEIAGSPWAFLVASVGVVVWLLLGPVFGFAELWWLIASTVCSVIPTLMVFLIQNMQNRDSKAMQLKLDELIRATSQARNHLIHLEAMSDTELEALENDFQRVRSARPRPLAEVQGAETQATGREAAELQADASTRSTSSP